MVNASNNGRRGISEQFLKALKGANAQMNSLLGLNRILEAVKADETLCLEIRNNFINIYYRGGNIMKITEDKERYTAEFDTNYIVNKGNMPKLSFKKPLNFGDVTNWLSAIPFLKHQMDISGKLKKEREFQQLLLRENNFKGTAKGTDYFICDIEYDNSADARFDLVAAYWPSSSTERKNNKNVGLAFIEMKYMDGALKDEAGIIDHILKLKKYLEHTDLGFLEEEMKVVFYQKQYLELIDNQKHIEQFSDRKPEYIFVFANHDPDSKILYDELQKVKTIASDLPFDLKFATSNFMGYGLYKQNIYGLDDFMKVFCKQIYSKAAEENEC